MVFKFGFYRQQISNKKKILENHLYLIGKNTMVKACDQSNVRENARTHRHHPAATWAHYCTFRL